MKPDWLWWATAVEIPTVAGLFWLFLKYKKDAEKECNCTKTRFDNSLSDIKENIASYKLEVAKSYASIAYLKDVENRLTNHLLRIEKKLDVVGKDK